jgi:cell shape-determining protein MreD
MNNRKNLLLIFIWFLIAVAQIALFSNLRIFGISPNIVLAIFSIYLVETVQINRIIINSLVVGFMLDLFSYARLGLSSAVIIILSAIVYLIKKRYFNSFGSLALIFVVVSVDIIYNSLSLLMFKSTVSANIDHLFVSAMFATIISILYILSVRAYGYWQNRELKIKR